MQKNKSYPNIKFGSRTLRHAIHSSGSMSKDQNARISKLEIEFKSEKWSFDDVDEFLNRYSTEEVGNADLTAWWDAGELMFSFSLWDDTSVVRVKHASRSSIEKIFSIFEEAPADEKIEIFAPESKTAGTIFIGHGRNTQWEKLKSHLQDKHEMKIEAYETGARAGHTIRDILDNMADNSSVALLVLTGEDKTADGKLRARQNVIHECGLFQGRLGFDKAIMLVEEGVELGSNFDGIQQLRFRKGRISEVFGDVVATIRRELGSI